MSGLVESKSSLIRNLLAIL